MVHQISSVKDFDDNVAKAGGKLIVIDFFATWCGPCKRIAPTFVKFSEEFTTVVFLKVDNDEEGGEDLTERYKVEAFPTFVLLKNGTEVGRMVGADSDELKKLIEDNK